ncbi:MAG: GNAT family N-acetyltransferase, partial [Acidimicrobiia bacterium]|nr:GNAT family N-acetyltransferase [Acidimicrobiia bacterium]
MDLDVRGIGEDELDRFWPVVFGAFGQEPTAERTSDEADLAEVERLLVVVDRNRFVGTAGAYSFHMTVPGGGSVPVAGVTSVSVLPTHRRRGALTAMMRQQLADVAARGEPIAVLTASEASIYGRFGYGLSARINKVVIDTAGGLPLVAPPAAGGSLRLVGPDEVRAVVAPLHDAVRATRAGELSRSAVWWDVHLRDREEWRDGASNELVVVHERDGVVDGALSYRVKPASENGVARYEVKLRDVITADPEVEAELLTYAAEIDLTTTMTTFARPVDDPLPYRLVDSRRYRVDRILDHLYVRVLDVRTALTARTYEAPGSLVLDIDDPFLPAAGGRYRLEVADDGSATCERIDGGDGEAELRLDAAALGTLYLGDVAPSRLARAGR